MKGKVTVLVAIGALAFASGALAAMVDGTSGNDHLHGTNGDDVIYAGLGDDVGAIEAADAEQQERKQRHVILPGEISVNGLERADVLGAVIRRQRHARQHYFGAGLLHVDAAAEVCPFGNSHPGCRDVAVDGRTVTVNSPSDAIRHGIGFVTEDRKRFGLVLDQTILNSPMLRTMQKADPANYERMRNELNSWRQAAKDAISQAWRTALDCVRSARDTLVPRAFMAVSAQCGAHGARQARRRAAVGRLRTGGEASAGPARRGRSLRARPSRGA